MSEIAIIGAGVAGLSVAYEILDRNPRAAVRVYEAAPVAGGNIGTDRCEGYTVEHGPNGFLDNVPETLALIERIGISDRVQPASQLAKRRFIWRAGKLHEIKANPVAFLASDILSARGKLRLLAEPFTDTPPGDDESVFDFAARHIGPEAAAALVDAMVSGVYAGDARKISLRSAFPKMHEMESRHGSLVRAMIARLRDRWRGVEVGGPSGPAGHLTSFAGGMAELIEGLVRAVGPERVSLGTPVRAIRRMGPHRFTVETADRSATEASAVVLAISAWEAAPLVRTLGADPAVVANIGSAMEAIPGAPITVVALAFPREKVAHPMQGFGFLVPRGEGLRILGSLWTSSIFPGRAPADRVLLRTMIGGAHHPDFDDLADADLERIVRDDLRTAIGIDAEPVFRRIYRYARGIPQYTIGHEERVARIEGGCAKVPGLHVAGNSYRGIAVNACVRDAGPLAERIVAGLRG